MLSVREIASGHVSPGGSSTPRGRGGIEEPAARGASTGVGAA